MAKIPPIRDPEDTRVRAPRSTGLDRPMVVLGVPGAMISNGYVEHSDRSPDLQGTERWRTFSDLIVNTAIIAAGVRQYLALAGKSRWRLKPGTGTSAERAADTVRRALLDRPGRPWHRAVRHLSMYKFYGFALAEIVYDRVDRAGVIGVRAIAKRPQRTIERWQLDRLGEVVFAVQRSPVTGRETLLPRNRVIHIVDDALVDNPEGFGLLRSVVRTARQLRRFEELEGYGFEFDLRGVPVGRAPLSMLEEAVRNGDMKKEDADAMLSGLRSFMQNHTRHANQGLVLDSVTYREEDESGTPSDVPLWSIELLKGVITGHKAVADAIQRKQFEIARVLGTDGMLLGSSNYGSMALSRDKSDNFVLGVESSLDDVATAGQQDLVTPICLLNGFDDPDDHPTLAHEGIASQDHAKIAKTMRDLALGNALFTRDDPAVQEVLALMNLPTEVRRDG